MRKYLFAAAVLCAALVIGFDASAAQAATCQAGYYYADRGASTPAIGNSYTVNVEAVSPGTSLVNTGHVAGWAGVTYYSGGVATKWIQAGLVLEYGNTLAFYIEINSGSGGVIEYWDSHAYYNVPFTVTITHVGNQQWEASINGNSYTLSGLAQNSGIQAEGEVSNDDSGTCNNMNYGFSSSSESFSGSSSNPPYSVSNTSSSGFTASGP